MIPTSTEMTLASRATDASTAKSSTASNLTSYVASIDVR